MKYKFINETLILKALEWAYGRSLMATPFPGVSNALTLAQTYLEHEGTLEEQINSLIRWQSTKAAAIGFVTGVGGVGTLPLMLPSNVASILFVQVRMIAAIAIMSDHDLKEDHVKTLIFACTCGSSALDILKSLSIKLGKQALLTLNKELILKINSAVGMRLLAKSGETGLLSMGKAMPILGGVIGGAFDAVTTNIAGNVAKKIFTTVEEI